MGDGVMGGARVGVREQGDGRNDWAIVERRRTAGLRS